MTGKKERQRKLARERMLRQHNDSGADVTLATIQINPDEVSRFGIQPPRSVGCTYRRGVEQLGSSLGS